MKLDLKSFCSADWVHYSGKKLRENDDWNSLWVAAQWKKSTEKDELEKQSGVVHWKNKRERWMGRRVIRVWN